MEPDVKEEYLKYLISLVHCESSKFQNLYRYLYGKEFYSSVAMDDNRARDGQILRSRFLDETYFLGEDDLFKETLWKKLEGPCTVLEMLVALAIRCEGIMSDQAKGDRTGLWFNTFIFNLGFDIYDDGGFYVRKEKNHLDDQLTTFLDRKYTRDGVGGLFPLNERMAHEDQRKVEIWYQMMTWLNEKGYVEDYLVK